jgi:DNA-binding GntR family transcriptional regulator
MTEAVERAYAAIRQGVLEGRFAPGTRLDEDELVEEIDADATSVREAIQRLVGEGVIEFVGGREPMVASWDRDELDQIFELRMMLESHAARLAAEQMTPSVLATLEDLAERMEALAASDDADRIDRIAALNNAFHAEIIAAANSRHLSRLLAGLQQAPLVQRTFRKYDSRALERSMAHHRELIDAFRARNGRWAETVGRLHIESARTFLRS